LQALSRARILLDESNMNQNVQEALESQAKESLKNIRVALIVVDYQNDFVDGSLAIGNGDASEDPAARIANVNRLIQLPFDTVVITKDWHPSDHISFLSAARNADRTLADEFANREIALFEKVQFTQPKRKQVLYPSHCVQNTVGAELAPGLNVPSDVIIVNKGLESLVDSYSAFMDNEGDKKSELHAVLEDAHVDAVVVCGLAYDICVFHTTKDAANLGFYCATARDASAALTVDGIKNASAYFEANLVKEMVTDEIVEMMATREFPDEWAQKVIERVKGTHNNNGAVEN
ncbi:hypothetical protein PFISCL1PPCAC_28057, partial [Pristionchus fissidentatus]